MHHYTYLHNWRLVVHLKGGAIETRTRFRLADRVSCFREFRRVYRTIHQLFSSIRISFIILISIQSIFKCWPFHWWTSSFFMGSFDFKNDWTNNWTWFKRTSSYVTWYQTDLFLCVLLCASVDPNRLSIWLPKGKIQMNFTCHNNIELNLLNWSAFCYDCNNTERGWCVGVNMRGVSRGRVLVRGGRKRWWT